MRRLLGRYSSFADEDHGEEINISFPTKLLRKSPAAMGISFYLYQTDIITDDQRLCN
jgi:hypothetical protein